MGPWHHILFTGLWCMADRKGRLEDRPERIEAEIFPFKFQKINTNKLLDDLQASPERFIIRYAKSGNRFIQVTNFLDHQYPHIREADSTIPAPDKHGAKHSQDRLNPVVLTPDSGVTESGVLTPDSRKPSAPERRSAVPHWQDVIKHINDAWSLKKRGAKYIWSGKDFSHLKRAMTVYQPWEIMALWDDYLRSDDEWARSHGFDVPTFISQIPKLVDDYSWKTKAKKYEDTLVPRDSEGMEKISALISGMGKEILK